MTSRILVVDDSPTIRRVVSAILERHGYEASLASDGDDALGALQRHEVKPDLVLLDFVMPRMNGYQFCRALRADAELANSAAHRNGPLPSQNRGRMYSGTNPGISYALVTPASTA